MVKFLIKFEENIDFSYKKIISFLFLVENIFWLRRKNIALPLKQLHGLSLKLYEYTGSGSNVHLTLYNIQSIHQWSNFVAVDLHFHFYLHLLQFSTNIQYFNLWLVFFTTISKEIRSIGMYGPYIIMSYIKVAPQ
jgi:hypothetical protein